MKTVSPALLALPVPPVLAVSLACPVCLESRATVVSLAWMALKANMAQPVKRVLKGCPALWAPSVPP